MPKVPERKLSYGEILENGRRISKTHSKLASKDFAQVKYVRQSKKSQRGYIKVTNKRKQPKEMKRAFKDNYLLDSQYRRIMNDH